MPGPRGRALFLVFACHLGSLLPASAAEWPVPRGPSREPVPYIYDPAAWATVPKAFLDDAPACTLYSGVSHLIEADGTVESVTHEVTRLNSRKAIDKLGEYRSISFTPAYEKLTLNEARVIKADGKKVPVEAKHVQLRDLGTDFQVYDTGKMLVISFPTLEVGDCLEVRWTTRGRNPEHGGHFFNRYTFGDDRYPVVRDEMRLRLPKAKPLTYAATGGKIEPVITEDKETRTYHWKAVHRPQLPQDDSLPSKEELRLQVATSTFASWHEVFEWKQQLRKECWECTPGLREITREVTKGLKTQIAQARALTYWVRRNVRYVSVGEKHDYTPHTPAQVLDTRFGDCKDTSQLLAVMLREAGIDVALVTLGTLDDGQILEEVPSPWGSHAILLVTIDGQEHWIDTTASLAGWDHLPRDDRDRVAYVIGERGLRLMRTPPATAESNRVETTTHMTVAADGSSRNERSIVYHGSMANNKRHDWVDEPIGERRRLATAELQDAQASSRLIRLSIDEALLQDYDQPVAARVTFEVPGHFSGDGDREGSITDSPIWSRFLAFTLDYERKVPFELGGPFESVHRYVIQLPPGHRLDSIPRDRVSLSRWGSFRLKVKHNPDEPRRVEIEYRTRLEKSRVEPADFEAFRKFHDEVSKHYRVWMTLKPSNDPADIPVLEAALALTPGDAAMAATLATLYLHDDKPDSARRVIQRARFYHPEDVPLAELAVEAAEGPAQEEAIYRELVKRFPDNAKYVVSLGEILVERGKHTEARRVLAPVFKDGAATDRSKAYYHTARSWFEQGKARDALKNLDLAAEADAESVYTFGALMFRARVHEKLDQGKQAAETYRQVLKLKADAPEALEPLIRLALERKDEKEALDNLRHFSIVVDDAAGLAKAAAYHYQLGRPEDAFALANRSHEEGGDPLAERTLGLILSERGQHEKALDHLEEADLDAPVLEALIRCHLARGQLTSALRAAGKINKVKEPNDAMRGACDRAAALAKRRDQLVEAARVPPEKGAAWAAAADALVCAEQAHAESKPADFQERLLERAFRDAVELGPAFALRAQLWLEKGRLSKALADAERAVTLSPKEARGYYVRGRVSLERGKDALADLARAADLSDRKDGAILHAYAAALFNAGQKAQAIAAQKEAVKLKPDDSELMEQLAEFEKGIKQGASGQ